MATLSVAVPQATFTTNAMAGATRNSGRREGNVVYIGGLSSFGGLKAHNNVSTLGMPTCTNQSFANVLSSLRSATLKKGKGGGALSSTCNAAEEIFRIAAIMNALVLVGVAVGFVLLRIEASLEEEA